MQREHIEPPENILFTTEITVRITDLNYGNHLGNDTLVTLLHEARHRFLRSLDYTEMDIEGAGIIMHDLVVEYKAEAFAGDLLHMDMSISEATRVGFDMYYTCRRRDTLVALAKTGLLFYNYAEKKVVSVPEKFRQRLGI